MNLLSAEVDSFLDQLEANLPTAPRPYDLLLSPSAVWLERMGERCKQLGVRLAAQDVHRAASGAHTGDLSALQAADAGAGWALCGHSERRAAYGEDDTAVVEKAVAAQGAGLGVVFCLGETLPEREDNLVDAVFARQLEPLLEAISSGELRAEATQLVMAYEPVWAIGTGRTATPEIAQKSHELLRLRAAQRLGQAGAQALTILYGGSVKPNNAAHLLREPDIDGFLIGGASLDPGSFLDIIRCCGF
jgi:triosephosphate isomerase